MVSTCAGVTVVTLHEIDKFVDTTNSADTTVIGTRVSVIATSVVNTKYNVNRLFNPTVNMIADIADLLQVNRNIDRIHWPLCVKSICVCDEI